MAEKYNDMLLPFLSLMRKELHANSRKGDRPGWLAMDANTLLLEVYWHAAKLSAAVKNNDGPAIMEHSADVANMAMMVLDVCGGIGLIECSGCGGIGSQGNGPGVGGCTDCLGTGRVPDTCGATASPPLLSDEQIDRIAGTMYVPIGFGGHPSQYSAWCREFARAVLAARAVIQRDHETLVAPAKVFTDDEIDAFYEAWEFNEADPGRIDFCNLVREIEHRVVARLAAGVRVPDDDWPPQAMKARLNASRERAAADYHEGRARLANTPLTGEDDAPPAA